MSFTQLTWGVKASFRNYVEAAGGTVTLGDGATRAEDDTFVFPAVPGGDLTITPDGSANGAMRFTGSVVFDAHGGMLKATLSELGLEMGQDGLILTAVDAPMNQSRCIIATLGPIKFGADGVVTAETAITLDGMYQIADNYPPGTALDPLQLA